MFIAYLQILRGKSLYIIGLRRDNEVSDYFVPISAACWVKTWRSIFPVR